MLGDAVGYQVADGFWTVRIGCEKLGSLKAEQRVVCPLCDFVHLSANIRSWENQNQSNNIKHKPDNAT